MTVGQMDGRTDRQTTDNLWYEIKIPFSKEKSSLTKYRKLVCHQHLQTFNQFLRLNIPLAYVMMIVDVLMVGLTLSLLWCLIFVTTV